MKNRNDFIYMLNISEKSPLTIDAYKYNLNQFYDIMGIHDEKVLNDYTLEDFGFYLNTLKKKYAYTSVNQKLATLQQFYGFLLDSKLVDKNLPKTIDKIEGLEKLPEFLEIGESKKLMETTIVMDRGKDIDLRNRLIVQIFLDSGIRAIEMERIRVSHINFSTREVYVLGKNNKERNVKFAPATLTLINEWLEERKLLKIEEGFEDYLFISTSGSKIGTNLKKRAIQYIIENYVKHTDIPQISTHKLRHTYATTMLSTGKLTLKELQERMGHKKHETTEIYAHALKAKSEINPLFD